MPSTAVGNPPVTCSCHHSRLSWIGTSNIQEEVSPLASAVGPSRAVEQLRLSSCTAVADHFGSWQRLTTLQLNALLFVLCCAGASTPWLQHAHLCSRKWWTPCCTSTKPGPVPACEGPCTRNEAWCPWQRCLPCEALCAKLLLQCPAAVGPMCITHW